MVQWLRLHTSTSGGMGSIPGQGSSACSHKKKKKERKLKIIKNIKKKLRLLVSESIDRDLPYSVKKGTELKRCTDTTQTHRHLCTHVGKVGSYLCAPGTHKDGLNQTEVKGAKAWQLQREVCLRKQAGSFSDLSPVRPPSQVGGGVWPSPRGNAHPDSQIQLGAESGQ